MSLNEATYTDAFQTKLDTEYLNRLRDAFALTAFKELLRDDLLNRRETIEPELAAEAYAFGEAMLAYREEYASI